MFKNMIIDIKLGGAFGAISSASKHRVTDDHQRHGADRVSGWNGCIVQAGVDLLINEHLFERKLSCQW